MKANIIKKPLLSEKLNLLRATSNQVIFKVDKAANKPEIKKFVESFFKVKVEDVRIINMKGKVKRQGRFEGKRPDWKKAVITLNESAKIEYFEGI